MVVIKLFVGTCKLYLRADWVYSLKEKRMILKSLMDRIRNKFNVSVAEVEEQDAHKSIVIACSCVTNEKNHANSILNKVIDFVEMNTDAEIVDVIVEIF